MGIRRSRGAFASGGAGLSTRAESLRNSAAEGDEFSDGVDDAIDPEGNANSIHERVVGRMDGLGHDTEDNTGDPNPRQRMNQVAMAGSSSYSREYRLTLLHRLLIRRIPLDQIAAQLKVSVSTIEKDRVLLKERLREQARGLDINEIIGSQTDKYDEIAGMALRIASDTGTPERAGQPTAMRLAAMRTTLAAEADRTRFLNSAGVFDVLRFRRSEDGTDISDVQRLMNRTGEMLERLMAGGQEESPTAAPRVRRSRAGGFKEFTMDDSDASSSSGEVVDL